MSRRQEKRNRSEANDYVKAGASAILFGIIITALVLMVIAIGLSMVDVPQKVVIPAAIFASVIGAFSSGYLCSRINGEKGFAMGLVCGLIMFIILYIAGIEFVPGGGKAMVSVKLFSILLGSAFGGIIGVNKRKRVK